MQRKNNDYNIRKVYLSEVLLHKRLPVSFHLVGKEDYEEMKTMELFVINTISCK